MEVAILFGLILLNGAFAMSEIALVTTRRANLQQLVDEGDRGAAAAARLAAEPTRFLSTVQIGITLIGVLNGVVGEATLAPPVAEWLRGQGVGETASRYLATGMVVAAVTYFTIVIGELVPKRLGQLNPESVARLVARPMEWVAIGSKPLVKLLSGSTTLVLRLLGLDTAGPAWLVVALAVGNVVSALIRISRPVIRSRAASPTRCRARAAFSPPSPTSGSG